VNTFVHFEINAENPTRAAKFYTTVFGWKIEPWNGSMEYLLCTTHKEDKPGVDGAIMHSSKSGMGTYNTAAVENLPNSLDTVVKAGGRIVGETQQIPNIGLFCYCEDTEGNIFGLLQPNMP
jgi:uncharacterized protein